MFFTMKMRRALAAQGIPLFFLFSLFCLCGCHRVQNVLSCKRNVNFSGKDAFRLHKKTNQTSGNEKTIQFEWSRHDSVLRCSIRFGSARFDAIRFHSGPFDPIWFHTVPSGSDRFDSMRPSSIRLGSIRSRSVRFGSVRFTVRFSSIRFGSVQFNLDETGSVQSGSVRFGTIKFGSAGRFGWIRFHSIRFDPVRVASFRLIRIPSVPFHSIGFSSNYIRFNSICVCFVSDASHIKKNAKTVRLDPIRLNSV